MHREAVEVRLPRQHAAEVHLDSRQQFQSHRADATVFPRHDREIELLSGRLDRRVIGIHLREVENARRRLDVAPVVAIHGLRRFDAAGSDVGVLLRGLIEGAVADRLRPDDRRRGGSGRWRRSRRRWANQLGRSRRNRRVGRDGDVHCLVPFVSCPWSVVSCAQAAHGQLTSDN